MILLVALLLGSQAVGPILSFDREVTIRIDPKVSIESVAKSLYPYGRIDSRAEGTSTYSVWVKRGQSGEKARKRILRIGGVKAIEPEDEPVDFGSVASLNRKLADLAKTEREGHPDGTDYLNAYRFFVGQRAFPNDSVDWGAYARGRKQVALMRSAKLGTLANGRLVGSTWQFLGPTDLQVPYTQYFGQAPVSGRVNAVAFDPNNSQLIYAAGAQGGLWKSADGGETWNWLSSAWPTLGVNCIAIDPQNGNTIYVGMGDYHGFIGGSYGIMKTTDGGVNWTEIATAFMGQVGVPRILIDPTNDQVIVAGTGDIATYGKLYRSTNGGQTWSPVTTLGKTDWPALAASRPIGTNVRFYAVAAGYGGTSSTASTRVYKSDDHGATWQALSSPVETDGTQHWAYCVAASPTYSSNVYVLDSEHMKLYSSSNQGSTWTDISANLPLGNEISNDYNFSQSYYDYHLECGSRASGASTADVLYVGEIDLVESVDNGSSWQSLGGPTYDTSAVSHNDQHSLAICPNNPNLAVFSNDGGIYSAVYSPSSNTTTVTPLNKLLQLSMFYKIALHPTNPFDILGGTQDNASPVASGNLSVWGDAGGGDGGGCAINQENPLVQYCTADGFLFYRTPDGWNTYRKISPKTGSDPLPFVAPLILSPSNQSILYTGTNYLYQYNDENGLWTAHVGSTRLTGPPTLTNSPLIQTIAVAPSDGARIYTGSSDGELWMSTNSGAAWTQLNAGATSLPIAAITSISVDPRNASDILIGLSGTGTAGHLWRCSNTLATPPVFSNAASSGSNALPSISLNAIARDLDDPETTWFVGTDLGVFRSADSGATWQNAGSAFGLPSVIVDDLVAVPGTRYLNAGTYGRGFWHLYLPPPPIELSSLTLSGKSTVRGDTVFGTVALTAPAVSGENSIQLSTSNGSVATVPKTVTVLPGRRTATFAISTSPTLAATASVAVTATLGTSTKTQTLTVVVPPATTVE